MWWHATMWHSTIPSAVTAWHPSENDVHFPCPLLHFPQPHWGVFLSLEMEGFWPNVPPGCNGCCMPIHHSWTLPGWIRLTKRHLAREEDIRCDVDENMWPNAEDRADWKITFLFICYCIVLWIFLFAYFVLSYNKWQLYCIFCYLAVMARYK